MSLYDDLVRRGAEAADKRLREHGPGWVGGALDQARGSVDGLSPELRETALAGLDALDTVRPLLASAGVGWAVELVARVGAGRLTEDERRAIESAPFDARRGAVHAATDAAHADYLARAEARAAVLSALLAAGQAAAKALLPLLLAAL